MVFDFGIGAIIYFHVQMINFVHCLRDSFFSSVLDFFEPITKHLISRKLTSKAIKRMIAECLMIVQDEVEPEEASKQIEGGDPPTFFQEIISNSWSAIRTFSRSALGIEPKKSRDPVQYIPDFCEPEKTCAEMFVNEHFWSGLHLMIVYSIVGFILYMKYELFHKLFSKLLAAFGRRREEPEPNEDFSDDDSDYVDDTLYCDGYNCRLRYVESSEEGTQKDFSIESDSTSAGDSKVAADQSEKSDKYVDSSEEEILIAPERKSENAKVTPKTGSEKSESRSIGVQYSPRSPISPRDSKNKTGNKEETNFPLDTDSDCPKDSTEFKDDSSDEEYPIVFKSDVSATGMVQKDYKTTAYLKSKSKGNKRHDLEKETVDDDLCSLFPGDNTSCYSKTVTEDETTANETDATENSGEADNEDSQSEVNWTQMTTPKKAPVGHIDSDIDVDRKKIYWSRCDYGKETTILMKEVVDGFSEASFDETNAEPVRATMNVCKTSAPMLIKTLKKLRARQLWHTAFKKIRVYLESVQDTS